MSLTEFCGQGGLVDALLGGLPHQSPAEVAAVPGLNITSSSLVILQQHSVSTRQLGGGAGARAGDGGVEDTEEPDDEAHDVLEERRDDFDFERFEPLDECLAEDLDLAL